MVYKCSPELEAQLMKVQALIKEEKEGFIKAMVKKGWILIDKPKYWEYPRLLFLIHPSCKLKQKTIDALEDPNYQGLLWHPSDEGIPSTHYYQF